MEKKLKRKTEDISDLKEDEDEKNPDSSKKKKEEKSDYFAKRQLDYIKEKEEQLRIDEKEKVEFFKYIDPNLKDELKNDFNKRWVPYIELYDYLANNLRYFYGKVDASKLKSDTDFNDFFDIYYKLEIIKRDPESMVYFVKNKEELRDFEKENFISWKKEIDTLQMPAAFNIIYCFCEGHLIFKLINNIKDIDNIKIYLTMFIHRVFFYIEKTKMEWRYNASNFMYYAFYATANILKVPLGNSAWGEWKKYYKLDLNI